MGFALLGGQFIFLFAVVVAIATLIYLQHQDTLASTYKDAETYKFLTLTQKTSVNITSVTYSNSTNVTTVSARNTGSTSLNLSRIDLFFNNIRIARDNTTLSKTISLDSGQAGIIDSGDEFTIEWDQSLESDNYTLRVSTQYGAGVETDLEVT